MPSFSQHISALLWYVNGGKLRRCVLEMQEVHGPRLERLTDGELLDECARVLEAPKIGVVEGTQGHGATVTFRSSLGTRDAEGLALGAEAFSRFPPAHLPRGSRLSDEQVRAAVHLMDASLVQMDTGEGKTFAISTAAFALLRLYERVYIITANEYLASRDAKQTTHFWNSVGVSIGLGLRSSALEDEEMWASRIVYTTLSALQFRSLEEDIADVGTERTITWSAALLDEADAALLDQSSTRHMITRSTAPTTKDWSTALRIATQLKDEHVVRDPVLEPSVTLTAAGEQQVAALDSVVTGSLSERLMLLRDIELAYAATRVAREGHDYVIRAGGALKVDPETGFLQPGQVPHWMPPLEQSRGFAARPREVERHATTGMSLLWRFEHLAGASGTVINEALDYLLLIGLPPVVIPPRVPRHRGLLPDVYAADLAVAHRWIGKQVADQAVARPILIATDSVRDAEALAETLADVMSEGASVRAVSGKTIAEERVFERAGRPGVTIVSTRVAGRGVDIRLSPEARAAGGPLLISIGHAPEARLDRQLLGRVGRNGDPYAAQFVSHPDDPFSRLVTNRGWMRRTISLSPDSVVESKMLARQLAKAQRRYRLQRLSQFAGNINQQQADGAAYNLVRGWRTLLPPSTDEMLPAAFVEGVVERYLAARFPGFVHGSPDAVLATEEAAAELALMARDPDARVRLVVLTTGQPAARSREIFTAFLTDLIQAAMTENIAARERMRAERLAAEHAVVHVRLLRFMRAVLEQPDAPDTAKMLSIALTADSDEIPAVSSGTRKAGLRLIAQALTADSTPSELEDAEAVDVGLSRTLRDLVAEVAEVILHGPAASPDCVERLRGLVDRAYHDRGAAAARLDARWRYHEQRSPRNIASETIDRATQRLVAGLDRTTFELSQTTSGPTYFRMYRRRIDALCGDVEATLSAEMIGNLHAARDPAALDELFAEREHAITVSGPKVDDDLALPPSGPAQRRPRSRPPAAAMDQAQIIEHFVEAMRERMGDEAPDERLVYPALSEILHPEGSSAVLTDPDKVAEAYARYKSSQARERIPLFRRRRVDKQVRLFFRFLHERGLAALMPTGVGQRSVSLARRFRSTFSMTGLGLGSVALLAASILCLVLVLLPGFHAVSPAPDLGLLDRIVSAGALSAGSALGPALLAIVGAAWVRWLAGFPTTQAAGQVPFERLVAPVLLVVGAVLVVRPGHGGFGADVVGQLVSVVVLIVVGTLIRGLVWLFESMVHIPVTAGLAAGFAALAAMPFLALLASWSDVLFVGGLTAAVTLGSLPLRRARLPVVAIHSDPDSPETTDSLNVPVTVRATLSIAQHATALLLAWMASCVLINGAPALRAVVAGVAYVVVLAAWVRLLARAATDPAAWREGMRSRQRTYAGTPAHPTLEAALLTARRQLIALELGSAVLPVVVATVLAARIDSDIVDAVPMGVAIVACSVFAVELGRAFVSGFRLPLAGMTTSPSQALEDTDSFTSSAQEAIRLLMRRLGYVVIIFGALRGIADVLDVWGLVESIVRWMKDTLF